MVVSFGVIASFEMTRLIPRISKEKTRFNKEMSGWLFHLESYVEISLIWNDTSVYPMKDKLTIDVIKKLIPRIRTQKRVFNKEIKKHKKFSSNAGDK